MAEWGSLWRCQQSLLLACSLPSDTHAERPTGQWNGTVSAPVCRARGPPIAALVYLIIRAFSPPISEGLGDSTKYPVHASTPATEWHHAGRKSHYSVHGVDLTAAWGIKSLCLTPGRAGDWKPHQSPGPGGNWVTALTNRLTEQAPVLSHSAILGCTHAHLHQYGCLPGCLLGSRQTPDGPRKYAGIIHCQVCPASVRGRAGDGAGGSCSQLMGRGWEMCCHPNMHWTGFCL